MIMSLEWDREHCPLCWNDSLETLLAYCCRFVQITHCKILYTASISSHCSCVILSLIRWTVGKRKELSLAVCWSLSPQMQMKNLSQISDISYCAAQRTAGSTFPAGVFSLLSILLIHSNNNMKLGTHTRTHTHTLQRKKKKTETNTDTHKHSEKPAGLSLIMLAGCSHLSQSLSTSLLIILSPWAHARAQTHTHLHDSMDLSTGMCVRGRVEMDPSAGS